MPNLAHATEGTAITFVAYGEEEAMSARALVFLTHYICSTFLYIA
jgi:hypothetical protein